MFLPKIVLSWVIMLACLIPGTAQNSRKILRQAEKRIEQFRKGDCSIVLMDESGQLITPGEEIKIQQTRHAFLFGCNITWLFNPDHPIKENEKNQHGKWASTQNGEARQAREVELFYTVLFSHPVVEAITWWDFYGDYKVSVLQNGKEITGTFRHDKNQSGAIQVKLK